MPEHLVTYPAGTLAKLVAEGKWKVSTSPKVETSPRVEGGSIERAKQLFGENFFGEEAIHTFEEKCQDKGINVKFVDIPTQFQYSDEDLDQVKQDEEEGKERMVILRPQWMVVKEGNQDVRKPVTILNLRELFKTETRTRSGIRTTIEINYDNNPFGDGPVFYKHNTDWFAEEEFAQEQMKLGYGLPTKEVIPDSWSKSWDEQSALFGEGEKRREAVETVWDSLLYYATTGKKILESRWDWTNSQTSSQGRVLVYWDSDGLDVDRWNPGNPNSNVGVCSSR